MGNKDKLENKLENMINNDRKEAEKMTSNYDDKILENELRNLILKNFEIKNLHIDISKFELNDKLEYEIKLNFASEK